MSEPTVVAAFQRLQAGDAAGALEIARAVAAAQPANARARLAAGIALRGLARFDEARAVLEQAAALDPRDYAVAYELGLLHEQRGDAAAALAQFENAARLRPAFAPAQYSAGAQRLVRKEWDAALERFDAVARIDERNADAHAGRGLALDGAGRRAEAERAFRQAVAIDPGHLASLRTLGTYCVSRGDFSGAASFFAAALARDRGDPALPIFLAQAELLLGRWKPGWSAYRRRETRVGFEKERAREGRPYRVPDRAEIAGRSVLVVAEQGLGDILFFVRFVAHLGAARVAFAGDARLHSLLARTGQFAEIAADRRLLSAGYEVAEGYSRLTRQSYSVYIGGTTSMVEATLAQSHELLIDALDTAPGFVHRVFYIDYCQQGLPDAVNLDAELEKLLAAFKEATEYENQVYPECELEIGGFKKSFKPFGSEDKPFYLNDINLEDTQDSNVKISVDAKDKRWGVEYSPEATSLDAQWGPTTGEVSVKVWGEGGPGGLTGYGVQGEAKFGLGGKKKGVGGFACYFITTSAKFDARAFADALRR